MKCTDGSTCTFCWVELIIVKIGPLWHFT